MLFSLNYDSQRKYKNLIFVFFSENLYQILITWRSTQTYKSIIKKNHRLKVTLPLGRQK